MILMDCNNATLGIILYYFKNILNIIWIVGPLLAIISLTINFIMLVKDPEDKKAPHKIRNSLIAYGVFCYILIHIAVNLLGITGCMPLTGVPLPFLSYGGSYTITLLFSMGLVERVYYETYKKRKK